jgi:hypothetical protein
MATKSTEIDVKRTEIQALLREHAGEGVSTDAGDNLVPSIRTLQPLSPLVVSGQAQAGDFDITGQIISGKEGFWFQPCWNQTNMWLEFNPRERGGGYVAIHPWVGYDKNGIAIPPPGLVSLSPLTHKTREGNDVVHYNVWAGILWAAPRQGLERAIKFVKTGHTVRKNWNTKAMQSNRFENGASQPLCAHLYRLTTYQQRNAKGAWFQIDVGPPVHMESREASEITGDALTAIRMGLALADGFKNQEKAADMAAEQEREQDVM